MTPRSPGVETRVGERGPTAVVPGAGRVGALVGLAALVVVLLRIGTPALWLDEATTVDAVTRSWPDLLRLVAVREAPLGPYYVLLKPWAALSSDGGWLRLPSALAVAVAAGLLAAVVSRRAGRRAGAAAGLVLALLPYVSRYAQEVRPYAFLVLGLVVAAAAWDALDRPAATRRARRGAGVALAVAVAFSLCMNVVAGVAVTGLVVARVLDVRPGWWSRLAPTALWSLAGLLLASPQVLLALTGAVGVANPPARGLRSVLTAATTPLGPPAVLVLVVVLGAVGLLRLRDGARPVVLLGLAWALVPPGLLAVGSWLQPSLAIPRYWLVALPGWAVLAGAGCAVFGGLLARATAGARGRGAGTSALVLGTAAPLGLLAAAGVPQQVEIRQADGHERQDPRPALDVLQSPAYEDLPVVALPTTARFSVVTYAPAVLDRMVLAQDPDPVGQLVVPDVPEEVAAERLAGVDEVAVLVFREVDELVDGYPALDPFTEVGRTGRSGWAVLRMERATGG